MEKRGGGEGIRPVQPIKKIFKKFCFVDNKGYNLLLNL